MTQNFAATGGRVGLDLAGGGDDTLSGGAGTDTVLVDQARGVVTVGGTAEAPVLSAPGMVLTLSGVERVRFADGEVPWARFTAGQGAAPRAMTCCRAPRVR